MATIGTFTKTENGYNGEIRTFTLKTKVTLVPSGNDADKAPDFRIMAPGDIEIGGAWQREGKKSGNSYLSLRLDDPSFTAPVYANLIERDGKHTLIWERRG
tara:strand:+ start:248 stop:550 length:303 start_codon:yes stop_codon:yes gene_type:complete